MLCTIIISYRIYNVPYVIALSIVFSLVYVVALNKIKYQKKLDLEKYNKLGM